MPTVSLSSWKTSRNERVSISFGMRSSASAFSETPPGSGYIIGGHLRKPDRPGGRSSPPFFRILIPFGLLCSAALADTDSQTWLAYTIEQNLPYRLELEITNDLRFKDQSSSLSESITEVGLAYRVNDHLITAIDHRISMQSNRYGERIGLSGTWQADTGSLDHRYRFKVQREWREGRSIEIRLRHRYQLQYDWNWRLAPYLAIELFTQLENGRTSVLKTRSTTGMRLKLTKDHSLKIFYRFQKEVNVDDPAKANILGLELQLEMKKLKSRKSKDPEEEAPESAPDNS